MHTVDRIDAWIEQYLNNHAPHSRSLIVTLFGDSILPYMRRIWTGDLVALLAPFGVSERLVRTSLYRLSEAGWVDSERDGRRSYYAPAVAGRRRFRAAYERVYAPATAWRHGWVILLASKGIRASDRAALRRELALIGFAAVETGVFMSATDTAQGAHDVVDKLHLTRQVVTLSARTVGTDSSTLNDLVHGSWSLQPAADAYGDFVACFEPLSELLRRNTATPKQAFVAQTLMIDTFRRATFKDPLLPPDLLPRDWPGIPARTRCLEIYGRLYRLTAQHLAATRDTDTSNTIPRVVMRRFGGLVMRTCLTPLVGDGPDASREKRSRSPGVPPNSCSTAPPRPPSDVSAGKVRSPRLRLPRSK